MSVNKVNSSTGVLEPIAGGTLYADTAIGSIIPFGGNVIPSSFLLCNGQSLLRTDYPELFAVIGTSFGSVDSTHFNIPDLRGEFLRGAGTNSHSGQGNGGSVGTHQDSTIISNSGFATNASHIRFYGYTTDSVVTTLPDNFDKTTKASTHGVETIVGTDKTFGATNSVALGTVRPTNTSVNYIIKATTIALPSDFEDAVDEKIAVVDGRVTTVSNKTPKQLQNGSISASDWALLSLRIQDRVINNSYFTVTVDLNQPTIFYIAKNNAYMFGVQAPVTFSNGTITLGSSQYSQFGNATISTGTSPLLLAIYGLVHK